VSLDTNAGAGQFRSGPTTSLSSIRSLGHFGGEEVLWGALDWVSGSAASTVAGFSGAVRLGELRSRAC